MAASKKDPTEAIRVAASRFADVDTGTSCTQGSFKVRKKAFLYIGPQGGRFKAMFKLDASRGEAEALAAKDPDRFQAGSTAWVTARFSADKPLPKKIWTTWLKESYGLSTAKAAPKKKAARKKASKKKAAKKRATKKKATRS